MAHSKAQAEEVAAKINGHFLVNSTMNYGMSTLHKEGKRLTLESHPSDSHFTWGASASGPFTYMSHEQLQAHLGFKPSAKDIHTAAALKTVLDMAAVTPVHPSVKEASARAGGFYRRAGHKQVDTLDLAAARKMAGYVPSPHDRLTAERFHLASSSASSSSTFGSGVSKPSDLPESFDWRDHSSCIGPVRNQGACGSCWAVSAAGAASDRACLTCSKGGNSGKCYTPYASQPMISCAVPGFTCKGGSDLNTPYEYMRDKGIPPLSVSPYQSGGGSVPSCGMATSAISSGTPLLHSAILGSGGSFSDPFRIQPVPATSQAALGTLSTLGRTIEAMKREIMTHGPITAGMTVFYDLMKFYNGQGVYQPISNAEYASKGIGFRNQYVGGHALEIIGWGRDEASNLPYWLVKNSWGTSWPGGSSSSVTDDSTHGTGYFKMIMYDGTQPIPSVKDIVPDSPNAGDPVLTFESTAHAAMFPSPPAPFHESGGMPHESGMPQGTPALSPANPLPFSPL